MFLVVLPTSNNLGFQAASDYAESRVPERQPSTAIVAPARHNPGLGIMPQGMQRYPFVDARLIRRAMAGAVELARGERVDGVLAGEQPAVGQHLAARVALAKDRRFNRTTEGMAVTLPAEEGWKKAASKHTGGSLGWNLGA